MRLIPPFACQHKSHIVCYVLISLLTATKAEVIPSASLDTPDWWPQVDHISVTHDQLTLDLTSHGIQLFIAPWLLSKPEQICGASCTCLFPPLPSVCHPPLAAHMANSASAGRQTVTPNFNPQDMVATTVRGMTANVYSCIQPSMMVANQAHSFHITRFTLNHSQSLQISIWTHSWSS